MTDEQRHHSLRLDHTAQKQNQEQKANELVGAQNQLGRQVSLHQTQDNRQNLAELAAKITDRQQRISQNHADEEQVMNRYHNLKRQELSEVRATQQSGANRTLAVDQTTELGMLDQFQQIQREQLGQRQQLERQVMQEQVYAVTALQERQQRELDEWQQRFGQVETITANSLTEQRQQLEGRQQQERAQLEVYLNDQTQMLKEYRDTVKAQMDRDQGALQRALYDFGEGVDRRTVLQEVLVKQNEARREFEQAVEGRLFSKFAQRAWANRFSDTEALKTVWEQSAKDQPNTEQGFDKARRKFWRAVNNGADANSETIRRILMEAGYELQKGENAPMLKTHWQGNGEKADRRLSLDHVDPKSINTAKILQSDNLRFMSQRDNSNRNKFYDENDYRRR